MMDPSDSQEIDSAGNDTLRGKIPTEGGGGGGVIDYMGYIGVCWPNGYGFQPFW